VRVVQIDKLYQELKGALSGLSFLWANTYKWYLRFRVRQEGKNQKYPCWEKLTYVYQNGYVVDARLAHYAAGLELARKLRGESV
jgi:hypothetical protein